MSTPVVIDIVATIECELDGQALAVHAGQGVIVVNVETAKTAGGLVGHFRRFGKTRRTIARLNAVLVAISHRLELHVDDVIVASMGYGTDSGLLRFVGIPHLRIWPLRLLRRSPPG